ncbi:hypothetical protein [Acidipropionibacterium thoenii]|uniref:hypothetical protein n=1 Tax=Acidipropionibacterium thoenii TaxID=1751 RepID=UPI0012B5ED91|nr:hypothetical protein [Acidipropionibacterium thoenii]
MSEATATIVASVVLIALPLGWAVWMWLRRHSMRSLLRGVAAALVPVGLWLLGLTRLITAWIEQTIHWIRTARLDTTSWVGLAVAAVGVIGWLGAGYIEPVTRKQGRQRRLERKRANAVSPGPAARSGSPRPAKAVKSSDNPDKAGFTDEDRDLMNLLKDRGID